MIFLGSGIVEVETSNEQDAIERFDELESAGLGPWEALACLMKEWDDAKRLQFLSDDFLAWLVKSDNN